MTEQTLQVAGLHTGGVRRVIDPGPWEFSSQTKKLLISLILVGLAVFLIAFFTEPERAWYSFLLNYFFFFCLGMSGLFFTALQHSTRSTWSVVVRRVAEGLMAYLPVAAALTVFIILGAKYLYSWNFPAQAAGHVLLHEGSTVPGGKSIYLSLPWFAARLVLFFSVWLAFAHFIKKNSVTQDQSQDPTLSQKNVKLSIAFLPIFALTFSLGVFDLLMSLQPHWYSTIFGVYCFAGLFQAGLSLITILVIKLRRQGQLAGLINPAHLKDLGGLLFAFSVFMAYIGFSQFMLIWYANLPEETFFFLKRFNGNWLWVALSLPLFKFFIPFFGLMSQAAKRSERRLLIVAWLVLMGEWIDIYWLVVPVFKESPNFLLWTELGMALGFAGLFGLAIGRFYRRQSIIPMGDPRLTASVNWQG